MTYNLDSLNATTTTSILSLFDNISTNSSYVFGTIILITIFFGFYFLFKKEETINDILASSFLTSIVGTLLLFIGWVQWPVYIVCLFILFGTFILRFIL